MSEGYNCELVMPQPRDATGTRRIVDLYLPQSAVLGYESDFELEITSADLQAFPSPPSTGGSFRCMGMSKFSSDSSPFPSPGLTSASEDWPAQPASANPEVTVEGDGSQLIHIPYESPFYFSPGSSRSFGFPSALRDDATPYSSFSQYSFRTTSTPSTSTSSGSSSSRQFQLPPHRGNPALIVTRTSDSEDEEGEALPAMGGYKTRNQLRGSAMLLVDTHFLSPSSTNIVFPTLSASCYFSDGSTSGRSSSSSSFSYSPWESERNYDGDLDVPYSAITPVSPMAFWDDKDLRDPLKLPPNEQVGVC